MVTKRPEEWAKQLWETASEDWINRIQDNNYRNLVVRPALEHELSDIHTNKGIFVDIGCGEGKETHFLREILKKKGFRDFYGFDTNKEFINSARHSFGGIIFDAGDFSELKDKNCLEERVDLITSLFVLQDTPNLKNLIKNVYESLKIKGLFLALIVHPQYAEILLKKGAIRVNKGLEKDKDDNYLFAGEYPITEPGRPPFFVPYFHRNLSAYIKLFEPYFHIESVRGLKPSNNLLGISKQEKISPFYEEHYNVYWKEISEVSSSLIIKGVKK
jgi:SAM-dependent methyltransferase